MQTQEPVTDSDWIRGRAERIERDAERDTDVARLAQRLGHLDMAAYRLYRAGQSRAIAHAIREGSEVATDLILVRVGDHLSVWGNDAEMIAASLGLEVERNHYGVPYLMVSDAPLRRFARECRPRLTIRNVELPGIAEGA